MTFPLLLEKGEEKGKTKRLFSKMFPKGGREGAVDWLSETGGGEGEKKKGRLVKLDFTGEDNGKSYFHREYNNHQGKRKMRFKKFPRRKEGRGGIGRKGGGHTFFQKLLWEKKGLSLEREMRGGGGVLISRRDKRGKLGLITFRGKRKEVVVGVVEREDGKWKKTFLHYNEGGKEDRSITKEGEGLPNGKLVYQGRRGTPLEKLPHKREKT